MLRGNVHALYFSSVFARVVAVYRTGIVEACGHYVLTSYANMMDSCVNDAGDLLVSTLGGVFSMTSMSLVAPAAGRIGFDRTRASLVSVGFDRRLRCS